MLSLFADSNNWGLSWWFVILMYLPLIFCLAWVVVIFWAILRHHRMKAGSTNVTPTNTGEKTNQHSKYLSGFVIDTLVALTAAWLAGFCGAFGEWDDATTQLVLVVAVVLFITFRLSSRLIFRLSPGELVVNAPKLTNSSYFVITLFDLTLGAIVYSYIVTL